MKQPISPEEVDELLPQTQCGLCGYGGCLPYAEGLVYENANINLCPPGGLKTLLALGEKLGKDPSPYITQMDLKKKPAALALIREAECIGCTKCIRACPVDAIIGTSKKMHTVISRDCTGCELCVPACPVDCIDMLTQKEEFNPSTDEKNRLRQRYQARHRRLEKEKKAKEAKLKEHSVKRRKEYILQAINRVQEKIQKRTFVRPKIKISSIDQ